MKTKTKTCKSCGAFSNQEIVSETESNEVIVYDLKCPQCGFRDTETVNAEDAFVLGYADNELLPCVIW